MSVNPALIYQRSEPVRAALGRYITPQFQPHYIMDNHPNPNELTLAEDGIDSRSGNVSPIDSIFSYGSQDEIFSDTSDVLQYHERNSNNSTKSTQETIQQQLDQLKQLQLQQIELMKMQQNQGNTQQSQTQPQNQVQQPQPTQPPADTLRYPQYVPPRPILETVGHSQALLGSKREHQMYSEANKGLDNPRYPLGMWLPSSGQEIFSHRNVTQNRMLGGYEAPERVLIAPPLDDAPERHIGVYEPNLYQEQFENRERLMSTGYMINTNTGEAIEVFENEMPPPQKDYSIEPSQMKRANPLLVWANGGYDEHAPVRKKTEIELEIPGADSGPNVFGDALYEKARKQEVANRINRDLFHNQNGNMAAETTIGEHPINKIGYQDNTPRVVHMPATQRATMIVGAGMEGDATSTTGNYTSYWQNPTDQQRYEIIDRNFQFAKPDFKGNDLSENTKRAFGIVSGDETAVQTQGMYTSETPKAHSQVRRLGDGKIVQKGEHNLYKAAVAGFADQMAATQKSKMSRPINTSRGNDDNVRVTGTVETEFEANTLKSQQQARNHLRGSNDTDQMAHTSILTDVSGPHVFDPRTVGRAKANVGLVESGPVVGAMDGSAFEATNTWTQAKQTPTRKTNLGPAPQVFQGNENLQGAMLPHQQKAKGKTNADLAETTPMQRLDNALAELGYSTAILAKQAPLFKQALGAPQIGGMDVQMPESASTFTKAKSTLRVPTRNQTSTEQMGYFYLEGMADEAGLAAANHVQAPKRNVDILEVQSFEQAPQWDIGSRTDDKVFKPRKTRKEDMVTKTYLGQMGGEVQGENTDKDVSNNRHRGKMLKRSGLRDTWEAAIGGAAKNQVFEGVGMAGGERFVPTEDGFQRGNVSGARSKRGMGLQGAYEERRRLSNSFSQGDNVDAMSPMGVPEQYVKPVKYLSERKHNDLYQIPYEQYERGSGTVQTLYGEYIV